MYYTIDGFQREASGLLNLANTQFNLPTPPPGVGIYYPDWAVTDHANHVAIIEQPANPPGCASGPAQLAVYTADASGNLNTKSTYKNMPASLIQNPNDMKMSPSGRLLAVGGQEGLQIFHFNGANPIRHYTNLITKDPISQMFWDNDNHLYAIANGGGGGKLFVFTITPTTHRMAPGSPHAISGPQYIAVQPLTH
jgi:6-phosphogluconolactonase (cycloisomerase 2 family)